MVPFHQGFSQFYNKKFVGSISIDIIIISSNNIIPVNIEELLSKFTFVKVTIIFGIFDSEFTFYIFEDI